MGHLKGLAGDCSRSPTSQGTQATGVLTVGRAGKYMCVNTRTCVHTPHVWLRLLPGPRGFLWTPAQAEHAVTQGGHEGLCPKDIP